MHSDTSASPDFSDYARPILQRKWLILVAVIVATGGVYAYYSQKPKQYGAGTLVFTQEPGDPIAGASPQPSTDRSVHNQAAILYSHDVAAAVKRRIGYAGSASRLQSTVSIEARTGQDIIEISARADEPKLVADIANGYAKEFVARSNGAQRRRVVRAAQVSREQLRRIPVRADTRTAREELADRIRSLDLALSLLPTATRQIDAAVAPTAAAAPKPARNALFAFALSVLLSVFLALGLERFDRRIKRPEDTEEILGMPLLAVMAHSPDPTPSRDGVAVLGPDLLEAFRALRTNLELGDGDQSVRTIVVTSAVAGEGKSTVVRNLALAFHETGRRVAIVEGDMRHPGLAGMFGRDQGPGLTEVLAGEAQLEDVVLRCGAQDTADATVTLLLSGALPDNPQRVVGSPAARAVLDELAATHDVTLIDSAPLLSFSDSVPLVRYADAVIVVARLNHTTRDVAKRLGEFLGRLPDARPVGVVANDLAVGETDYGHARRNGNEAPRGLKKVVEPDTSDHRV